ncbi:MAG: glutamate cyclase domain-containing protein, partial [Marmoricola sp.]
MLSNAEPPVVIRPEAHPAYESLDRLAVVEMRPPTSPSGIVGPFYDLCRRPGDLPLTRQVADLLLALTPSGAVLIVTGLVDEARFPRGEIDGPIGSAALARALALLGHRVTVAIDAEAATCVRAVFEAACVSDVEIVTPTPATAHEARDFGAGFDAAIAVEKLGRNSLGERHLIWGTPVEVGDPFADEYVLGARAAGRVTIGVGDNGNEIGFGVISDVAEPLAPAGVHCEGGFFAATPVDVLLPASVSNFGCYAIVAALALGAARLDLAVAGDEIRRWTQAGLDAGLRSGGVDDPDFQGDDGVPLTYVRAYADLLAGVVHQNLLGDAWLAP